ncbi:MAG: hypothetical protein FJY88_04755 [Candidatus Eisenbacteria bacterium]|nr:hypothetical protein [Candidatus Eisenbacteria bacterium]
MRSSRRSTAAAGWVLSLALGLLWVLAVACPAIAEAPPAERAAQERAETGAWASPAAAWHHLLLAREAARAGNRAPAVSNYRLAATLDPDLLGAWLGLARLGAPSNPALFSEAITGAGGAIARNWEIQRRLCALAIPPIWTATTIAAVLALASLGLRHIRRRRHVLVEGLESHLGLVRAKGTATLLCLVPVAIQWGLAATAAAYAGLSRGELSRREKGLALVALLWLLLMPGVWKLASPAAAPIAAGAPSYLVSRAQREVPTPELERAIADADRRADSAAEAFALGMIRRRQGKLDDARSMFARAAAGEGTVARDASLNLANILFWSGDAAGAARAYEALLDAPGTRWEARYNLAVALSRLRRFEEADQRLDEAARLDFGRIRSETRIGGHGASADVTDGLLSAMDLWALEKAGATGSAPAPLFLSWLYPGGRSSAAPFAIIAALLAGGCFDALLRRRLRVRTCMRCGTPVCRRCVTRVSARSYCRRCASLLGMPSERERGRLLLRRVMGEDRGLEDRLRDWGAVLLPGVGLIARGRPLSGALLAWLFLLGLLLATGVASALPPSPLTMGIEEILGLFGLALMILSAGGSAWIAHRVVRRPSVRHFFERDSYKLAA